MFDDIQERQLTQAVADLAEEFPDVPLEVIVGLMQQAHDRYETATVRAFLPILVTKDVRALLRNRAYLPDLPTQTSRVALASPSLELAAGWPI